MKFINFFFVSTILSLMGACSAVREEIPVNIDFGNLEKSSDLFSDDFVQGVSYLHFDPDTNARMRWIKDMTVVGERMYCHDGGRQAIHIFDKEGRFISKVSHRGRGEEDYPAIEDFAVDPADRTVEILSCLNKKLYVYTEKGEFVKKIPDFNAFAVTKRPNGNYVCYRWIGEDSLIGNYTVYERTPGRELVKGYLPIGRVINVSFSEKGFSDSYDSDHKLAFSHFRNKVYRLSADTLKEAYSFDFDTLAFPADLFHGSQARAIGILLNSRHYMITNALENKDYAFFYIQESGNGSSKIYYVLLDRNSGKACCQEMDRKDWRLMELGAPIALNSENELVFQVNPAKYNAILAHDHPLFQGEPIADAGQANLMLVKLKLK